MDVFVFIVVLTFVLTFGVLIKRSNKKAISALDKITSKARTYRSWYLLKLKRPLKRKNGKWFLIGLMGLFYLMVIVYYFLSTN
jgi:hypothetical protein